MVVPGRLQRQSGGLRASLLRRGTLRRRCTRATPNAHRACRCNRRDPQLGTSRHRRSESTAPRSGPQRHSHFSCLERRARCTSHTPDNAKTRHPRGNTLASVFASCATGARCRLDRGRDRRPGVARFHETRTRATGSAGADPIPVILRAGLRPRVPAPAKPGDQGSRRPVAAQRTRSRSWRIRGAGNTPMGLCDRARAASTRRCSGRRERRLELLRLRRWLVRLAAPTPPVGPMA